MVIKIEKIFEQLIYSLECDSGYLFESDSGSNRIIHSIGIGEDCEKEIGALNSEIAASKKLEAAKIKKTDSFKALNQKYKFDSLFTEKIFNETKRKIYLVMLSKNSKIFALDDFEKINFFEKILLDSFQRKTAVKEKIKAEKKNKSKSKPISPQWEESFRLLFEVSPDFISILNSFGYFVMVNKNGAHSLGYSPDEMIGKHFLDFINEDSKPDISRAIDKMLNDQGKDNFETTFVDKFGKNVIYNMRGESIKTDGEITGLLSIGRDISLLRKDEKKLGELNSKIVEANRIISIERERAERQITVLEEINKLKSEFIANISHELRTPLASIVGFAETLVSDDDLPEDMKNDFTNIILSEGKRLAKLINDLLDYSKLESDGVDFSKTDFELIGLLREVISNFEARAEKRGVTLSKEIPEAEINIFADKDRITSVLNHLISNAVKYSEKGGRITIIIRDFLKEVELIISDTGVGIAESDLPYIFEKIATIANGKDPAEGGSGFGLITVKKIIDLHKGIIRVKSEENEGTTFIIRLPK